MRKNNISRKMKKNTKSRQIPKEILIEEAEADHHLINKNIIKRKHIIIIHLKNMINKNMKIIEITKKIIQIIVIIMNRKIIRNKEKDHSHLVQMKIKNIKTEINTKMTKGTIK